MPKKKTGARKKAEKQRQRQAAIRAAGASGPTRAALFDAPGNTQMVCSECGCRGKERAFCYFCGSVQRLPRCAQCGAIKCLSSTGDCLVRHNGPATGLKLVGAICDFCEAWVCHSRRCVAQHGCLCPMRDVAPENVDSALHGEPVRCEECTRSVWEHGGRVFPCPFCDKLTCEDDAAEHAAMCQRLESEDLSCVSCARQGQWSCLRCKVAYCATHVRSHFQTDVRAAPPCKKCRHPCTETKDLSMSVHRHRGFGRQGAGGGEEEEDNRYFAYDRGGGDYGYEEPAAPTAFTFGGVTVAGAGAFYSGGGSSSESGGSSDGESGEVDEGEGEEAGEGEVDESKED